MQQYFTRLFLCVAATLLLSVCFMHVSQPKDTDPVGKPVPLFELPGLMQSQKRYSEKDLTGSITLLHVWRERCAECSQELALLEYITKEYGLRVVGLYHDIHLDPAFGDVELKDVRNEVIQKMRRFSNPYAFTILDRHRNVAANLGVINAPEHFLLDERGIIRWHHSGEMSEPVWEQELVPIIEHLRQSTFARIKH